MKKLVLASQSPYRKALLERLGVAFVCAPADIDEDQWKDSELTPTEVAEALAIAKARKVAQAHPDAVVIGSDQVIELDGEIFNKPGTPDKAMDQLSRLSGKVHHLICSVCVLVEDVENVFSVVTRLHVRNLSPLEISRYVRIDDPVDCAGSYKIEKLGISLFERIDSPDFTAIEGLPLMELTKILREEGFNTP